ncbi:MAG: hypothetical protein AB1791_03715 [Chloroflexota bacterium]
MTSEVTQTDVGTSGYPEGIWPEWVYPYSAGLVGGLLGGAAVSLVGVGYGLLTGHVWRPINVVGAVILRDMQGMSGSQLDHFSLLALLIGLIIHAVMSAGVGLCLAFVLPALPGRPLYWGLVIGPLLWVGALVAALPIINPVMVRYVDLLSFSVAMVAYGVILGWWIDRTPMIHLDH